VAALELREVIPADLAVFFANQLDSDANRMAAFVAKDPTDGEAFTAHWTRILGDETITIRTIELDGQVAGNVLAYVDKDFGKPEVAYWIGKDFWGTGVATQALSEFLGSVITARPIYARAAKDNVGSLRVLEKCGFEISGEEREHSNARGEEVEAFVLELVR
jgi:RimJ/RimL family protein N-acetyltransferase